MDAGKNIVLGITGSIAAFKACDLIGLFRKRNHSVRCMMSADADRFVTPLTLETLSGREVAAGMFDSRKGRDIRHVSLAEEADVILIAPASADVIAKIAAGICDDILLCVVCAARCPVVIAPAMNDGMFNNSVIQDKIKYLQGKGYHFIPPVVGRLACGHEGLGHLAPLEKIVQETEKVLST